MQNSLSPETNDSPSYESVGSLIESDRSIARKLEIPSNRNQRGMVKKISELLGRDRKEVLEEICFHYAEKRKTEVTMAYVRLYMSEPGISAENLASIFRSLIRSVSDTIAMEDYEAKKMPRWLGKIMKKADSFGEKDPEGVVALFQGRISQLFTQDYEKAIEQYGKSYLHENPEVYNPLGETLADIGLTEDALSIQLEWWKKYHDLSCLENCVRLAFKLKKNAEAVQYYQVLKALKPDVPHLVNLSTQLNLSHQIDLVKDYFRSIHFRETEDVLTKKTQDAILYWTRGRIEKINAEKAILQNLVEQKERERNISRETLDAYHEELYQTSLELLDLLHFGAIGLLDDEMTELYMENISRLLDAGEDGREFLFGHIEYTRPYAALWVDKQNSNETADSPKKNSPDEDFDPTDEFMGVLDMILAYHYDGEYESVMEWYEESAKKILLDDTDRHECEEDICLMKQDVSTEKKMFSSMSDELQFWYNDLRNTIDREEGVFFRKRFQSVHRSGTTMMMAFTSSDIVLFSIADGFLWGMDPETIFGQYMEQLTGFELSYEEWLHLCNLCFHFGYKEFALDLLCSNMADWRSSQTVFLALRLIYDLSEGNNEIAEKIIERLGKAIDTKGSGFKNFESFLESHVNSSFVEEGDTKKTVLLHEIAGLSLYLYGEREECVDHLTVAHEKGSATAFSHLAQIYSHEGREEKAYETLEKTYSSDSPQMLFESGRMVELAIATGRRKEAKRYLSVMEADNIKGATELRFYYLATGTEAEKLEAIRLLGIYDDKTLSNLDESLLEYIFDKIQNSISKKGTPKNTLLICKRTQALFPSPSLHSAIEYWEEIQKTIQENKLPSLLEYLELFTEDDTIVPMIHESTEESEEALSLRVQIAVNKEALFFRNIFIQDKNFPLIVDLIARTIELFSWCEALAEEWHREGNKRATAEHAFTLGYDRGNFGKKPTLH